MKEEMIKIEKDTRAICKYGVKCYQKNVQHHAKFKHPPPPSSAESGDNDACSTNTAKVRDSESPQTKRQKMDNFEDANCEEGKITDNAIEIEEVDEDQPLPPSPITVNENIKQKFLMDMPKDFYDFWKMCKEINNNYPNEALSDLNISLVGPYDILNGSLNDVKDRSLNNYLCHWRFYYDPPEFQTVIVGSEDEYHIGYFRDDPAEDPVFVASMCLSNKGIICPLGDNIFAAVSSYINVQLKKIDLFKRLSIAKLQKKIEDFAKENNYSLDAKSSKMKERQKKVVSKSFHGAGIVVPVNKKTDVGYREIPESNASLKRMLKKVIDAPTKEKIAESFVDIQELITNAQWATDEGDFGMGLELGIDLFIFGGDVFHPSIKHLLTVAYDLLNRPSFALIIKAHLQNRRKGSNMSIV